MAVIPSTGGVGGSDIEPGMYIATVTDVLPHENQGDIDPDTKERTSYFIETKDWGEGPKKSYKLRLVFQVQRSIDGDDEYEGEELSAKYTASMNERSKLFPVVRALLGRPDLEEYYPLDPHKELIGKTGIINVVLGSARNDGGFWRNIETVAPMKSKKAKKPVEPATDADFEDEDAA